MLLALQSGYSRDVDDADQPRAQTEGEPVDVVYLLPVNLVDSGRADGSMP